jgi:hypothetical protein
VELAEVLVVSDVAEALVLSRVAVDVLVSLDAEEGAELDLAVSEEGLGVAFEELEGDTDCVLRLTDLKEEDCEANDVLSSTGADGDAELHFPNPPWQPLPQYSVVDPLKVISEALEVSHQITHQYEY